MSFSPTDILHIDGMLPRGRYSSNEWDWETIGNTVPNELVADSCGPFQSCEKDSHKSRWIERLGNSVWKEAQLAICWRFWGLHLSLPQGIELPRF